MTVRIRIPSVKGDSVQELELREAKETLDELLQKCWLVAVDGKAVQDSKALEDGSEVLAFPKWTTNRCTTSRKKLDAGKSDAR